MTGAIHFAMTHSAAGGLREIWSDIAEGLAARGHATRRFVLYPPEDPVSEGVDWDEWHHVVEAKPRSLRAAVALWLALVRYLRRERPAAIVTAMPAANVLLPIAVLAARVPTRVFVSHHSPTDTHNRLLDWIDGWTGSLPCVAGIISVSDAVGATLAHKPARYRAKRITVHNALPQRVEAQIAALPRTRGNGRRLIALGRLTRQKNYPMLIRALAAVPGATLEIVGHGEDEAALRSLAVTLGVADRIIFTGWLTRQAALARAAAADVFVQVSLFEGHSLALIEAARLALPLVVSDVPVQVEGVTARDGTRCGIVVPLGDDAALSVALATLAGDAAARAHWSALAARLGSEVSNAAMLDRYEAMLAPAGASR